MMIKHRMRRGIIPPNTVGSDGYKPMAYDCKCGHEGVATLPEIRARTAFNIHVADPKLIPWQCLEVAKDIESVGPQDWSPS